MRFGMLATLSVLLVHPAFANVIVDPAWPWPQRINTCVSQWYRATAVQQGTMTYRQFTAKCVAGKTALPFKSDALCANGSAATGTEEGGACAHSGGVSAWLK